MADSQNISGTLNDPRMDNTGNRNNGGNKKGSKRTVTLVREVYEKELLKVAGDRIPAIMEQIALDAENEDLSPHVRQKAQAMLLQAVQKAGDQDIAKEIADDSRGSDVQIEIKRDGVLIQSGGSQVSIGGGSFGQVGVGDAVVPYDQYGNPNISNNVSASHNIPLNDYSSGKPQYLRSPITNPLYVYDNKTPLAPGSNVPLTEFVGPHRDVKTLQQLFMERRENDSYLNAEIGWSECYCVDRPVGMNFNVEHIDE